MKMAVDKEKEKRANQNKLPVKESISLLNP